MRMEQNFGPHMEQKRASLNPSSGRVESCFAWAASGIEGQTELVFPAKLKPRFGQFVVPIAGAGTAPGDVGRVGGDFISDAALTDVFGVGQ
jgi:hypothetical protein